MKGKILNKKYKIVELIAYGGQSNVYLANNVESKEKVAIKKIDFDKVDQKKLKQESQIYKLIESKKIEGITPLIQTINRNGIPEYYVFPFRKTNLSSRIHQLNYSDQKKYALRLLKILSDLHKIDIVHRDIKPSNILIDDNDMPEITDLGIGKTIFTQISDQDKTGPIGTREYAAPEQFIGDYSGKESDVFSIGVLIYQIFSGGRFPKFSTRGGKLSNLEYEYLSEKNNKFDIEVDEIIKKSLDIEPGNRFIDAGEMYSFLQRALNKKSNIFSVFLRIFKFKPVFFIPLFFITLITGSIILNLLQDDKEEVEETIPIENFVRVNNIKGEISSKEDKNIEDDLLIQAENQFEQGNYENAITEYDKLIQIDSNNMNYFFGRGKSYLKNGDHFNAAGDFNEINNPDAIKNYNFYDLAFYLGELNFNLGNLDESLKYYEDCYAFKCNSEVNKSNSLLALSNYHYSLDEFELSLDFISQAISLTPDNYILYLEKGHIYLEMDERTNALNQYNIAKEKSPESVEPYIVISNFYFEKERYELSIYELNLALENNIKDFQIYYLLALNYYEKLDSDEDIEWYSDEMYYISDQIEDYANLSLEIKSNWHLPFVLKANNKRWFIEDFEGANKDLDRAILLFDLQKQDYNLKRGSIIYPEISKSKLYHDKAKIYYDNAYYSLSDYKDDTETDLKIWETEINLALLNINKAIELEQNSNFFSTKSEIYLELENYELSLEELDKFMQLKKLENNDDEVDPYDYKRRAEINNLLENFGEAAEDYSRAVSFGISKNQTEDELADVFRSRGYANWNNLNFENFYQDFKSSLIYDQTNASAYYEIGDYYYFNEYDLDSAFDYFVIAQNKHEIYEKIEPYYLFDILDAILGKIELDEECNFADLGFMNYKIESFSNFFDDCISYGFYFLEYAMEFEIQDDVKWYEGGYKYPENYFWDYEAAFKFYSGRTEEAFAILNDLAIFYEEENDIEMYQDNRLFLIGLLIKSGNYSMASAIIEEEITKFETKSINVVPLFYLYGAIASMYDSANSFEANDGQNANNFIELAEKISLDAENRSIFIRSRIVKAIINYKLGNSNDALNIIDSVLDDINDNNKSIDNHEINFSKFRIWHFSDEDNYLNNKTPLQIKNLLFEPKN